jgi:hypothetical protein
VGFLLVGNGNTIFVVNINMKVLPPWSVNHNTGFNKEKNEGITPIHTNKNPIRIGWWIK